MIVATSRGGPGIRLFSITKDEGLQPAPIRAVVNYGYLIHLNLLMGVLATMWTLPLVG